MNNSDDNGKDTCASRWDNGGYVVTYYGIGDPWIPGEQPHQQPLQPPLPYNFTPTPAPQTNEEHLAAFKLLAEQIKKLAAKMPGRKNVKKLSKRLAVLEERVTELERKLKKR